MERIEGLDYEVRDGVARLTINRPDKLNALSPAMYEGLRTCVLHADMDPEVQLIAVTATGDRSFCVGGDLVQGTSDWSDGAPEAMLAGLEGIFPFQSWERSSKLIVTAVNGLAQAAGLIAVLMSDLVVASDRARFRVPEALRGLTEPFIPVRLPLLVGMARARWMIFTGEEIDAAEAERIGLVGKVVPHEELGAALESVLATLKRTGPRARTHYKRMLNAPLPPVVFDEFLQSMRSDEPKEGMRSFAEKRLPSWVDDDPNQS